MAQQGLDTARKFWDRRHSSSKHNQIDSSGPLSCPECLRLQNELRDPSIRKSGPQLDVIRAQPTGSSTPVSEILDNWDIVLGSSRRSSSSMTQIREVQERGRAQREATNAWVNGTQISERETSTTSWRSTPLSRVSGSFEDSRSEALPPLKAVDRFPGQVPWETRLRNQLGLTVVTEGLFPNEHPPVLIYPVLVSGKSVHAESASSGSISSGLAALGLACLKLATLGPENPEQRGSCDVWDSIPLSPMPQALVNDVEDESRQSESEPESEPSSDSEEMVVRARDIPVRESIYGPRLLFQARTADSDDSYVFSEVVSAFVEEETLQVPNIVLPAQDEDDDLQLEPALVEDTLYEDLMDWETTYNTSCELSTALERVTEYYCSRLRENINGGGEDLPARMMGRGIIGDNVGFDVNDIEEDESVVRDDDYDRIRTATLHKYRVTRMHEGDLEDDSDEEEPSQNWEDQSQNWEDQFPADGPSQFHHFHLPVRPRLHRPDSPEAQHAIERLRHFFEIPSSTPVGDFSKFFGRWVIHLGFSHHRIRAPVRYRGVKRRLRVSDTDIQLRGNIQDLFASIDWRSIAEKKEPEYYSSYNDVDMDTYTDMETYSRGSASDSDIDKENESDFEAFMRQEDALGDDANPYDFIFQAPQPHMLRAHLSEVFNENDFENNHEAQRLILNTSYHTTPLLDDGLLAIRTPVRERELALGYRVKKSSSLRSELFPIIQE